MRTFLKWAFIMKTPVHFFRWCIHHNDENEQDDEGKDDGDDYETEGEYSYKAWRCDVDYVDSLSDL